MKRPPSVSFSALCLGLFVVLLLPLSAPLAAQPADPLDPAAGAFLDADATRLGRAADSAYQAKSYLDAARLYLSALRADPAAPEMIYNLACCYGRLGRDSLAARYLERAQRAGFKDVAHARLDPDFDAIRTSAIFAAAVESVAARSARADSSLGRLEYCEATSYLPCRIHLPPGYDSTRATKLVIGLHGYGDQADHFTRLWERIPDPDFIFAVPEAPYAYAGGGLGYSWWIDRPADSATGRLNGMLTETYVVDLVKQLGRRYAIGDVYLLGFSQGAGLSYIIGLHHPDVFRGIAPFGGWLDSALAADTAIARARDLRVFIGHGKEDPVVAYGAATGARDVLKRLGFKVTFFDYPGGHRLPPEGLARFREWLDQP